MAKVGYICIHKKDNRMSTNKDIEQLTKHFKCKTQFTRSDLLNYYQETEPDIKDNTLKWRVHNLKKNNIIRSVGKGIYAISGKAYFHPEPNNFIIKVNKIFLSRFDEVEYCVWQSSWLYGLMVHQPFSSFYVFEVEREVCKDVFNLFKDEGLNAFYQPDESVIDDYVSHSKNAIIIKPLVSRSPLYKAKKVMLASIEKILVDIFYDNKIYPVFNLSEQVNIIGNLLDNYTIDFSKLLNYAKRRNRYEKVKTFINNNFDNILDNIV